MRVLARLRLSWASGEFEPSHPPEVQETSRLSKAQARCRQPWEAPPARHEHSTARDPPASLRLAPPQSSAPLRAALTFRLYPVGAGVRDGPLYLSVYLSIYPSFHPATHPPAHLPLFQHSELILLPRLRVRTARGAVPGCGRDGRWILILSWKGTHRSKGWQGREGKGVLAMSFQQMGKLRSSARITLVMKSSAVRSVVCA